MGEFPRQAGGNGRRAQGRREDEQPHSFTLGPCPVFTLPHLDPATFARTFTSSASLLPALGGSDQQLLGGPRGQQHGSRLPGRPPRGKSQPGLSMARSTLGTGTGLLPWKGRQLCLAVWHSVPCVRPTDDRAS